MKLAIVLILLFCAVGVKAQDAKVIIVSDQDAKKAARLYAEKQQADKEYDDFVKRTAKKYTEARHDSPETFTVYIQANSWNAIDGWQYGIQFSSDFKAIIPADYKPDPCSKYKYPFGGILTLTNSASSGPISVEEVKLMSDKAFGVNDLKPNKSHLIPGKSADGNMADPLQTAKHSRQEVDELIALGKEARGEKLENLIFRKIGCSAPEEKKKVLDVIVNEPVIADDFINQLIENEDFAGRLMDIEKKLDKLEERLVKTFTHMGFKF